MTELYLDATNFSFDFLKYIVSPSKNGACINGCTSRIGYLIAAPLAAIGGLADLLEGCLSFGNDRSVLHLDGSTKLLSNVFFCFVRAINPSARLSQSAEDKSGLITHAPRKYLNKAAKICNQSENCFVKHIVSRLLFVLILIVCVITRVMDTALAICFTLLVLLSLGTCEELNNHFYTAWMGPLGIVEDLIHCLRNMLSPTERQVIELDYLWSDEYISERSPEPISPTWSPVYFKNFLPRPEGWPNGYFSLPSASN